jgi:transcriptional regulator with XRE-family HTH domain
MKKTTLGENVRAAREHELLSLRDAGHQIGMSCVHLSRIECGHANPSIGILVRIAAGLDTTIAHLLKGVE